MAETVEQYVARILSHVRPKDAIRSQTTAPKKLAQLIRGVSRTQLRKRPAPGKWSVVEILAHLSETELVIGYRIRKIVETDGTPIQAYDQDRWAEEGNYAARDPHESLDLFTALRRANLALLKSLSPTQRKQHGMHAERGPEDIERIICMVAGHDINHIRQIEKILGRASAG